MSYLETSTLKNSTIMLLYSEKDEIQMDPMYQRMGGVWTLEKRQLLIDSILNDYDIPKIYFHTFDRLTRAEHGFAYAVIDGRQRLETIWQFIEGNFVLSDEFEYQKDSSVDLAGLSYEDIAKEFPRVRIQFDSFVLPVVSVVTDDADLIEDMFSRLNEAVPLNAAEKRNAIGGDMVQAIRNVASKRLFTEKVRFNNTRYQHLEVAARFLFVEESLNTSGKLLDTKKVYLDNLARIYYEGRGDEVDALQRATTGIIARMSSLFVNRDELLQAQGNMVVYYLLFRSAIQFDETHKITRRKLLDFRELVKANRISAEENYAESSYDLLEYDRLSQQGTNDASNIKERFGILADALEIRKTAIY